MQLLTKIVKSYITFPILTIFLLSLALIFDKLYFKHEKQIKYGTFET